MAERIGEYLSVERLERPPKRKTDRWRVVSNYGDELGTIQWFGRWRQYTFHPAPDTVFNRGCMIDLCAFLEKVNAEHRQAAKERARA